MTAPATAHQISIRVTPRARRNVVLRDANGTVKVYVTAPPEDGRANEAVLATLADWLGVKRRQVRLVRGTTSRTKLVRVEGESPAQLASTIPVAHTGL